MKNLKIELHLLQNFPPSCLNRDDTNTPKTCEFGGVTRARVSSQCWKRAIREHFRDNAPERRGIRSKRLKSEIITGLVNAGKGTAEALGAPVEKFITTFYVGGMEKNEKRKDETDVLVFYSPAELDTIIEILSEGNLLEELGKETPDFNKNDIQKRLKKAQLTADVAFFGRMLASKPELNVDAACQVAHAISTHSVNLELDFFTAVDDLKDTAAQDDAGAGMLGTVGYDSACYYRYALVDYEQLWKNLNKSREDADASLEAFLRAFYNAIPGAKKNSFAHGNPPFFAFYVVRREGTPASLVNAFAKPVNARHGNLLEDSATALAHQAGRLNQCYELYEDTEKVKTFLSHTLDAPRLEGLPTQENVSMRKAIAGVLEAVTAFREAQA